MELTEETIEELTALKWVRWLERPYGAFIVTLLFGGVDRETFQKVGMFGSYRANLYQYPDALYSSVLGKDNATSLENNFTPNLIFEIVAKLENVHANNCIVLNDLLEDKKKTAIEKLIEVQKMVKLYAPFLWFTVELEQFYTKYAQLEVRKYIKTDVDKFIGDVSIPIKLNEYGKMLKALKHGDDLIKVKEQYGWLKSRDGFTDFYSTDELEDIRNGIKGEVSDKVFIPDELRFLVSQLQELTYFRTDRTDKFYSFLGLARPIFEQVADEMHVSFKALANYSVESIIADAPNIVSVPYTFIYLDGIQYITDKKVINFENDNIEEIISGRIAFKGVVRGKAKIVKHPSEVGKVEIGDVLISQMTLPSFISAMQKAAAFVTDEGSITCHAAIVAREMKKPCIIGTKVATKVLKDGDMVEVDADNGVVKIISSS